MVTTILKYWNSRTFKDVLHQIPKLSRPYSIFKDFPGPGKMERKKFQGLSRTFKAVWPPCKEHAPGYEPPNAIHLLSVRRSLSDVYTRKYARSASACSLLRYLRFSLLRSLQMSNKLPRFNSYQQRGHSGRGVDPGGLGRSWPALKICRRGQTVFWPPTPYKMSHSHLFLLSVNIKRNFHEYLSRITVTVFGIGNHLCRA